MNPKINMDAIITYLFLKKFMLPITQSEAYKKKLVDAGGRVIKTPENEGERASLTLLDKLCFTLRRLLGGRINTLNNFLYMQTLNGTNMYNQLIVKGSIEQRAEIKRITKDFEALQEKYNMPFLDMIKMVLNEELHENKDILGE